MRSRASMFACAAVVASTAACGDNRGQHVQLSAYGAPAFIAYRDGYRGWRVPEATATDAFGNITYDIVVVDWYEAIIVCSNGYGGHDSWEFLATSDEVSQYVVSLAGSCGPVTLGPSAAVSLDVDTTYVADVFLGSSPLQSNGTSHTYTGLAPIGIDDLIVSDPERILVRRGLSIDGPTTLPPIDLATDGATWSTFQLSVTGVTVGAVDSYGS